MIPVVIVAAAENRHDQAEATLGMDGIMIASQNTLDQWRSTLQVVGDLRKLFYPRMCRIASIIHDHSENKFDQVDDSDIVFTDKNIEFTLQWYQCGDTDYYQCSVPHEYMYYTWDAVKAALYQELDDEKRKQEEKAAAARRQQAINDKQRRRELYDKLRKEFAGEQATLNLP